jgi:hypothetical protein
MATDIACFLVELSNPRTAYDSRFDLVRRDTGEVLAADVEWIYQAGSKAPPPGAMWWQNLTGTVEPGGRLFFRGDHLSVMTPGGVWVIDGRAANCDRPEDMDHRCWVRRGRPPAITVDKNGNTCSAGAGSISCGAWHGFLRDGRLVDA